jgi:hypothetical protein
MPLCDSLRHPFSCLGGWLSGPLFLTSAYKFW